MASTDTKLTKLDFLPGFHRESTQYAEEGKWFDGNRVRFREGKPENLRGYQKFGEEDIVEGFPRALKTWTDDNTRKYQAYGTNKFLYVTQGETQFDSTPIIRNVSVTASSLPFSFTSGSNVIGVSLVNSGVSVGDRVILSAVSGTSASGITDINKMYTVTSTVGLNNFFISATTNVSNASSTLTSTGTQGKIKFVLPNEPSNNIQGLGYGAGTYTAGATSIAGRRAWNSPASASNITFLASMWTLDTFDEDLLAQRRFGQIFRVDTDASTTPERAVLITASPTATSFIVSPNDRHTICYGARALGDSPGSGVTPMLVRWSAQSTPGNAGFNDWTPSSTNSAGDALLTEGSRIIGAIRSRNAINVWTDMAMYTQTFIGGNLIFRFNQVGSNCGLIGPHAAIDVDGISYWMGDNNFFAYDGRVQTMDCPIRRHLFDSFNMSQKEKVYAGINSEFQEVIWLYPTEGNSEPDSYIIYNYEERTWVFGKLFEDGIVSVFQDRNVYDNTITIGQVSATDTFLVYDNEPADIFTGNGQPLSSFVESASFDLADGTDIMFVDRIIPDYTLGDGESVNFFITTKDFPTGNEKLKGPFVINQVTEKINLRARGRQATVKVSATNSGQWKWGSVRMALGQDGKR